MVDTVKQVIKDRKADSPSKVLALKLLNSCVAPGHDELIMYMEKKIMSRLAVFARHRKVRPVIWTCVVGVERTGTRSVSVRKDSEPASLR